MFLLGFCWQHVQSIAPIVATCGEGDCVLAIHPACLVFAIDMSLQLSPIGMKQSASQLLLLRGDNAVGYRRATVCQSSRAALCPQLQMLAIVSVHFAMCCMVNHPFINC